MSHAGVTIHPIMTPKRKNRRSPAPRLRTPKAPADEPLVLTIFGERYVVDHCERHPDQPTKRSVAGSQGWTYYVRSEGSGKAQVLTLSLPLLPNGLTIPKPFFPVAFNATPDRKLVPPVKGVARIPVELPQVGVLVLSDDTVVDPPCGCWVSCRPPTSAERARFHGSAATSQQPPGIPGDRQDLLNRVDGIMDGQDIKRPKCRKVVHAMAELGAISPVSAKAEKEILKQAGSKSYSINSLFADHSGDATAYSEFRRRHIKNTGRRDGTYYLDLKPGPARQTGTSKPTT